MKIKILFFICVVVVLGLFVSCTKDTMVPNVAPATPTDTTITIKFSSDIYPIFTNYSCTACHGMSGGLTLTGTPSVVRTNLITSGAVVPNSSVTSRLYTNFNGKSHNGKTLTTKEVTNIKTWIDKGAPNN